MSIRHLYPNATEPTAPRFKVGDIVHSSGSVRVSNTWYFSIGDTARIAAMVSRVNAAPSEVLVYPPVFGVVVDYQDPGTELYVGVTLDNRPTTWRGCEHDYEECEHDLPGSGSIWFLPDNERRYFVRWANKRPYQYGTSPAGFDPLTSDTGVSVFSLSLTPEHELKRCMDFAAKLRARVNHRKQVISLLEHRLNIDSCSTQGIASIVVRY